MSMYSGLEVRVPFCDYRIAEYLYAVPWEYKDLQGREKGLLREAVKDLLPEQVLFRKKSPYPKTFDPEYTRLAEEKLRRIREKVHFMDYLSRQIEHAESIEADAPFLRDIGPRML